MKRLLLVVAALGTLGFVGVVGAVTGALVDRADTTTAVCHAPSEDSFPTDCDYHDGGWYRK
jgi:hypothetical protein